MYEIRRTDTFSKWLDRLRDARARVRVLSRNSQISESICTSNVIFTVNSITSVTPNIASEGRRSAQHGGVRSIGWLGGRQTPLLFTAVSIQAFTVVLRASILLYDLFQSTTRSCGFSVPSEFSTQEPHRRFFERWTTHLSRFRRRGCMERNEPMTSV